MTKYLVLAPMLALILMPSSASAHETQQFRIGHETYQFVVGSLNEPVTVDDKSGVELRVSMAGHETMAANDHHGAAGAVTGLEETLEVEIQAGGKTKTVTLRPMHGEPGTYYAPFYPTVATTYAYRFFGTIDGTPVDLTFTCSAAGHATASEDTTEVEVSDGVTRIKKTGSFGCPAPKEDLGFPEPATSMNELAADVDAAQGTGMAGVAAGALALLAAGYVTMRRK